MTGLTSAMKSGNCLASSARSVSSCLLRRLRTFALLLQLVAQGLALVGRRVLRVGREHFRDRPVGVPQDDALRLLAVEQRGQRRVAGAQLHTAFDDGALRHAGGQSIGHLHDALEDAAIDGVLAAALVLPRGEAQELRKRDVGVLAAATDRLQVHPAARRIEQRGKEVLVVRHRWPGLVVDELDSAAYPARFDGKRMLRSVETQANL